MKDVNPAEFIPIAEDNGSICDIGLWVLNHVFALIAYPGKFPEHLPLFLRERGKNKEINKKRLTINFLYYRKNKNFYKSINEKLFFS